MKLESLKPALGSTHNYKRVGRGQGSGKGGTSARGNNGAQSRSGYSRKMGFEGGQMPLQRRLPKFGFKNPFRVEYKSINLDVLQLLIDSANLTVIDKSVLHKNGLVAKSDKVKLLGRGELKSKISITLDAFSSTAKSAVEALGGRAIVK